MRKLLLGAAGAAFIALGGCTTTSGTITIADVQAAAQTACNFLPTAASVANLLSADPAVATAEAVAAVICGAVTATTAPSARFRAAGPVSKTVVINGQKVTITGSFTQ